MEDFYNKLSQMTIGRAKDFDKMNKQIPPLERFMMMFFELEFEWGVYTIKICKLRSSKRLCLFTNDSEESRPFHSLNAELRREAIDALKGFIQEYIKKKDEEGTRVCIHCKEVTEDSLAICEFCGKEGEE